MTQNTRWGCWSSPSARARLDRKNVVSAAGGRSVNCFADGTTIFTSFLSRVAIRSDHIAAVGGHGALFIASRHGMSKCGASLVPLAGSSEPA